MMKFRRPQSLNELILVGFGLVGLPLLIAVVWALVNLDRVVRLEPIASGGYLAHTDLGAVVDVSRQAARALRRRFGLT